MEIKNEKYLVAFLDLLGAAERLKTPEFSSDMIQIAYDMAKNAINSENRSFLPQCKVYTFSDNIALCIKVSAENELQSSLDGLSRILADMIWMNAGMPKDVSLSSNGFMTPVRGAIYYGDLCIDDEINFLIGEALANAYMLESKVAKMPRVIIDKQLEKYITKTDVFSCDDDGYYFIDYLQCKCSDQSMMADAIVKIHAELITNELEQSVSDITKHEKVLAKYMWLAKYFNRFISNHALRYGKYKIDINKFMAK